MIVFGLMSMAVVLVIEPVVVTPIEFTTKEGTVRGLVATVDLRDDRVEIVVDDLLASPNGKADSELVPTDVWAAREGLTLAVNANFFGVIKKDDKAKGPGYFTGAAADIMGLCVSDGVVVSPVRSVEGSADPAIIFGKDRKARVGRITESDAKDAWDAVAGIGMGSDDLAGTVLIEAGVSKADSARVEPSKRHPRTAAGVSKDGWTLTLIVLDGRQKDWSVGATLGEVAEQLIARGVSDAVALDGGGSSAMIFDPTPTTKTEPVKQPGKTGDEIKNKPSDGAFRPVANHLGVRLIKPEEKKAGGGVP